MNETAETVATAIAAAAPWTIFLAVASIIRARRGWDRWCRTPYPEPRHRRHHRRPPNRPETPPRQPQELPPMTTQRQIEKMARRLARIIEEHDGDAFEVTASTEEAPKRYALVEMNVGGSTPPYWVTTHDTPSDAAAYSINQEYASDWGIVSLTDLQTGERVQTTVATVVEVTFP